MTGKNIRYIIGCMTGTSVDGLSAALMKIEGQGLQMRASFQTAVDVPFGPIGPALRKIVEQVPATAEELTKIAWDFGVFHADSLEKIIQENQVDLIALHGQTVFHAPPYSWQLINPVPVAQKFKIPIVYDLRASDLAQGGEGAPLTPLADFIFFRAAESRAIVNLGGFCNVTILPAIEENALADLKSALEKIQGKDVCACNQVLDYLARALFQTSYDDNGQEASKGTLQDKPFDALVGLLSAQASGGRSLGTGDELSEWVAQFKDGYAATDLARSACAAIAQVIVNNTMMVERLILAGGGILNLVLKEDIIARATVPVEISDAYGIPIASREAASWAVLGALSEDRIPITLSQVTGVKEPPLSGAWIFP